MTSPFEHTGFAAGTRCYYVLTAVNAFGESSPTAQLSPPPPPAEVAGVAGDARVTLSWAPVAEATSYKVYWSALGDAFPDGQILYEGTATGTVHSSLTNGTSYFYAVSALTTTAESMGSTQIECVPQVDPPEAPWITASIENETIVVSFGALNSVVSRYTLFMAETPGIATATATRIEAAESPYQLTQPVIGKDYFFAVTAHNVAGTSGLSREVAASVPVSLPPEAPKDLTIQNAVGSMTLTWSPSADAIMYTLYVLPGSQTDPSLIMGTGQELRNATSPYRFTGPAGTYHALVIAANLNGNSQPSAVAEGRVLCPDPMTPGNVQVQSLNQNLTVTCDHATNADQYTLLWSETPFTAAAQAQSVAKVTSPYTHPNPVVGKTYFFAVMATNADGVTSPISAVVDGRVPWPVPTTPGNVQVKSLNQSLTVTWDPAANTDSYTLFWSEAPFTTAAQAQSVANVTSPYTHPNAVVGKTYFFAVMATNADGVASPLSAVVEGRVPLPVPAAPVNVVVQSLDQNLTVTWDPVANADRYTLFWSETPFTTAAQALGVPNVTSSYTHFKTVVGKTYYFAIMAYNTDGVPSPLSAVVAGIVPAAPTAGVDEVVRTYFAHRVKLWSGSISATEKAELSNLIADDFCHSGLNKAAFLAKAGSEQLTLTSITPTITEIDAETCKVHAVVAIFDGGTVHTLDSTAVGLDFTGANPTAFQGKSLYPQFVEFPVLVRKQTDGTWKVSGNRCKLDGIDLHIDFNNSGGTRGSSMWANIDEGTSYKIQGGAITGGNISGKAPLGRTTTSASTWHLWDGSKTSSYPFGSFWSTSTTHTAGQIYTLNVSFTDGSTQSYAMTVPALPAGIAAPAEVEVTANVVNEKLVVTWPRNTLSGFESYEIGLYNANGKAAVFRPETESMTSMEIPFTGTDVDGDAYSLQLGGQYWFAVHAFVGGGNFSRGSGFNYTLQPVVPTVLHGAIISAVDGSPIA